MDSISAMGKSQFVELSIPPRVPLSQLAAWLAPRLPLLSEQRLTLCFHDTFDWRLYRAGLTLAAFSGDDGSRFLCRQLPEGKLLASDDSSLQPPYFAWDIRDSRLRELLEPKTAMRALLAQASIACSGTTLRSADGHVSVRLLHCELPAVGNTPTFLGDWLILESDGEGQERTAAIVEDLARHFALDTAEAPLLLHALTALGRRPEDPTPSPTLPLDPQQRADTASKAILLQLLNAMEVNETGLMERTDTEFLHDFRVAVRRTRSALGQIKEVLPPRTVDRFLQGFAWLGGITGMPRDLDVNLLGFEDLRRQVPHPLRPALEPLKTLIAEKADSAYAELIRQLRSRRYRQLKISWRKTLESPPPKRPKAANARRPVAEVADERILKVFRRVLKQGKAISDDSPDEQLHELRKTCKKLRYLLEFFQNLYPPDKIRSLIKHLKGFQNHLGELQDLSAQIQSLYGMGQELRALKTTQAETLLAMGALLGHLDLQRRRQRESFGKSFREFAGAENHAHYRRLFSGERAGLQISGDTRE